MWCVSTFKDRRSQSPLGCIIVNGSVLASILKDVAFKSFQALNSTFSKIVLIFHKNYISKSYFLANFLIFLAM